MKMTKSSKAKCIQFLLKYVKPNINFLWQLIVWGFSKSFYIMMPLAALMFAELLTQNSSDKMFITTTYVVAIVAALKTARDASIAMKNTFGGVWW